MTFGRVAIALSLGLFGALLIQNPSAQAAASDSVPIKAKDIFPKVIAWRRDIHEHPELSGHEERTAKLVADHLKKLGLEVKTNVGGFGVVGILRGGKPGPVIGLRADMDALPVTEEVDVPFASHAKSTLRGRSVGVMHACGHDTHTAILMGVAEILTGMKADLPGTVKFIFQPAEEGMSDEAEAAGHSHGAKAMVEDGAMDNPKIEAVFGLHVGTDIPAGAIGYRSGPAMASSDTFSVRIEGKSSHGALPWLGVDPAVVSAQIILGFQTIISRQSDIAKEPAVVTVGLVQSGNRENIIPDRAFMQGTMRTFDEGMRADIKRRLTLTAEKIAEASEAKATVAFDGIQYGVTSNDPALTKRMLPSLERAAPGMVMERPKSMPAEDFSEFASRVPGFFFFLGVTPEDKSKVAPNHSPRFMVNEAGLEAGIRAMTYVALDYLNGK